MGARCDLLNTNFADEESMKKAGKGEQAPKPDRAPRRRRTFVRALGFVTVVFVIAPIVLYSVDLWPVDMWPFNVWPISMYPASIWPFQLHEVNIWGPSVQRDVNGSWSGMVTMQDSGPPDCKYSGNARLALSVDGNSVQGTLDVDMHVTYQPGDFCDPQTSATIPVFGTTSSTSISLTDEMGDHFTGTFTSDTLRLNGVSATVPPPSGATCAEFCGWTQVITLTKDR